LLFCTVHYPFADGAAAEDIRLALNRCPELRQENATFWNWIGPRRSAKTLGAQKRALKSLTFATSLDDSSLVFGSVELKDKGLILSVKRYFREGKIKEVADYCETDVVGTYQVWLRYELFRGTLSQSAFEASQRNLADFVNARGATGARNAERNAVPGC